MDIKSQSLRQSRSEDRRRDSVAQTDP